MSTLFFGLQLGKGMRRGLPVSLNLLTAHGYQTGGILRRAPKSLQDLDDLEQVRQLSAFFGKCKRSLALLGEWLPLVAELMGLQGKRVVVIRTSNAKSDELGLWNYLEGNLQQCPIKQANGFDLIEMHVTSRYGVDRFSRPKFTQLLAELEHRYDHILIDPGCGVSGAELLFPKVQQIAAGVREETFDQLLSLFRFTEKHEVEATLLFKWQKRS